MHGRSCLYLTQKMISGIVTASGFYVHSSWDKPMHINLLQLSINSKRICLCHLLCLVSASPNHLTDIVAWCGGAYMYACA